MSTFQPSQSQHVDSAYGALGGDENETHWYDVFDLTGAKQALTTASDYYTGGSSTKSSATASGATPAAKAVNKTTGKLASGRYKGPGGYIYSYSSGTGDITIVVSPKGGAGKVLTSGSAANKAVYAELLSKGVVVSDAEVRASKVSKVPAFTSSASTGTSVVPGASASAVETPFYKQTWFPFAVGGGILLLGIFTYALWPEPVHAPKRKKLPVQVIMKGQEEYEEEEEAA